MFLPIPSLNYKYEINSQGRARNTKTKKFLKPLKREKGGRRYRFCFEGKKVERTIAQLLFEVHGKTPPHALLPAIPVTVVKDGDRKFFKSFTSAAKFLEVKTNYAWHGIRNFMVKRCENIYGWQIMYHDQEQRKFRSVDAILGAKYFKRENKYWSKKKRQQVIELAQRQRKSRDTYFAKIDFIFYHEKEIREAVLQARLDSGGIGTIRIVNGNGTPDPTARQAIKNLTPLPSVLIHGGHTVKQPEYWLIVIDKTYSWCKRQKDCRYEVATRRYNNEDYRKTCNELNISNSTRRRLFELVQIYAALQAVQLGLIQV